MNDHLIAKLSAPAPAAAPKRAEPVPPRSDIEDALRYALSVLPCTMCVVDAKQAVARRAEVPEPLPGAVMLNGMLLCDVRHQLNVGTPGLIVAQPGQMPGSGLVG